MSLIHADAADVSGSPAAVVVVPLRGSLDWKERIRTHPEPIPGRIEPLLLLDRD